MPIADRARRAADYGRKVVDRLGLRPSTATVTIETFADPWSTGATPTSTTTYALSPRPKIVEAGAVGVPSYFGGGSTADGGANLSADAYRIGPITPAYPGGGYSSAQLIPPQPDVLTRVYVVLTGPEFQSAGEKYQVINVDATNALHFFMDVVRTVQQ